MSPPPCIDGCRARQRNPAHGVEPGASGPSASVPLPPSASGFSCLIVAPVRAEIATHLALPLLTGGTTRISRASPATGAPGARGTSPRMTAAGVVVSSCMPSRRDKRTPLWCGVVSGPALSCLSFSRSSRGGSMDDPATGSEDVIVLTKHGHDERRRAARPRPVFLCAAKRTPALSRWRRFATMMVGRGYAEFGGAASRTDGRVDIGARGCRDRRTGCGCGPSIRFCITC